MALKKLLLSSAALILMALSIAIIYCLVTAGFYATGVFWDGAVTGIFGCMFLALSILSAFMVLRRGILGKKRGLILLMLIVSGLATVILLYYQPEDSDVWWYGAIAGFFSCLSLILFAAATFIIHKLTELR